MKQLSAILPEQLKGTDVLEFWFDSQKTTEQNLNFWFAGTPEIDACIRDRFSACVRAASEGFYAAWEKEPDSCLALILLLDQFPLNIHRGLPSSFQTMSLALPIAERALKNGFHKNRSLFEKLFLYLPFEHSENLQDQQKAVELFTALHSQSLPEEKRFSELFLKYAVQHLEVIERFGRFPTWNKVLGRTDTPEEAAYIAAGESPF